MGIGISHTILRKVCLTTNPGRALFLYRLHEQPIEFSLFLVSPQRRRSTDLHALSCHVDM